MSTVGVQVPHIKKSEVEKARAMEAKGLPQKTIASELGCGYKRVGKMLRLVDRYGIEVFADD